MRESYRPEKKSLMAWIGIVCVAVVCLAEVGNARESIESRKFSTPQGTAFKVDDGVWLTAKHVAMACSEMVIEQQPTSKRVKAQRLHPQVDVALLFTDAAIGISGLAIAEKLPTIGETGFLYGYPKDQPLDLKQRLLGTRFLRLKLGEQGLVRQKVAFWSTLERYPRTVSPELGGASGAPVIDAAGAVIGLHIASVPRRGRTFSITPEALSLFVPEVDDSTEDAVDIVRPHNDSAPAWRINGEVLRGFETIARVRCLPEGP